MFGQCVVVGKIQCEWFGIEQFGLCVGQYDVELVVQ